MRQHLPRLVHSTVHLGGNDTARVAEREDDTHARGFAVCVLRQCRSSGHVIEHTVARERVTSPYNCGGNAGTDSSYRQEHSKVQCTLSAGISEFIRHDE